MNEKIKHIIFFMFLLLFNVGKSQVNIDYSDTGNEEVIPVEYDTNYIASYTDIFTPRIIIINKRNDFVITEEISGQGIEYSPNSPLNLGLGLTYKWFSFNIAFNFPFINNDDEIYGETKRFDFQSNVFAKKFTLNFFFQLYNGFYIANPLILDPGWQTGDPYPARGDVSSVAFGASGFYIFNNKKFSYRAAFNFNERQKKSAGSFIVGGGILNYRLKSDTSGLVPNEIFPDSVQAINFDLVRLGSIFGKGGYVHTFIVRNWYFNIGLDLGLGLSTTRIELTDQVELKNRTRLGLVTDFRGSVGYNSEVFYAGLSWSTGAFIFNSSKDILITYSRSTVNFYVGYRFYKWFNKEN